MAEAKLGVRRIDAVRRQRISPEDKVRQMALIVQAAERAQGSRFVHATDDKVYFFDGAAKRLYPIWAQRGVDPDFGALLYDRYDLLYTEKLTMHVVALLESYARTSNEPRPTVNRFSYYDVDKNILYVSAYNGEVYRLDGGEDVLIIDNGSEVLFLDDDEGKPCEPLVGSHDGIIRRLLVDDLEYVPQSNSGMTPSAQKLMFHVWMFAIAFPELLSRGQPILIVEGQKGSGKTSAVRRVQALLKGRDHILKLGKDANEEDLAVALLRHHVCVLDNIDTFVDWLADALAAYATGAYWARRKRFSDDAQSSVRPRSFVAVTTRNPISFYRDDVADRCLLIRLARRKAGQFVEEQELIDAILRERPALYGEWLHTLNEIIRRMKSGDVVDNRKYRLSGYAKLCFIIGRAIGYTDDEINAALTAVQEEREEFVIESDPFVDVLEKWLEVKGNVGRDVSARDLYTGLSTFALNNNLPFRFKSPQAIARHLRDSMDALARKFVVTKRAGHNNVAYYSFLPKDQDIHEEPLTDDERASVPRIEDDDDDEIIGG